MNRAALPGAVAVPELPARPASVLTTPAGVILRIVWLLRCRRRRRCPRASTATPFGESNGAAGGGVVTVSTAALLFTLPEALVNTARKRLPLSASTVAGVV